MKILDFLKRIFSKNKKENNQLFNVPKTQYQRLVESIDDLELCKMFVEKTINRVTPEIKHEVQKYKNKSYEYSLQTKISKENTLKIAKLFFKNIDDSLCQKYTDIVSSNNQNITLKMEEFNGKGACVNSPEKLPLEVYVPIRGDIRQLYELVHECTHTFDIDNVDKPTRKVLGEVAPQCMERLLEEFLLEMSDEEMQEYGFDRKTLEKDIKDRRITTFLSRFHNAQTLNKGTGDRMLDSRYMLAQIYSAHFNKFDKENKKEKLLLFINCVKNDKFDMANKSFELLINKKEKLSDLHRENYVNDTISEVVNLIAPRIQYDEMHQQVNRNKAIKLEDDKQLR